MTHPERPSPLAALACVALGTILGIAALWVAIVFCLCGVE